MSEQISASENKIIGKWKLIDGEIIQDKNCDRIEFLTNHYLIELGASESQWEVLFQDPIDKRLWVKTYPNSEIHAGGAPELHTIDEIEAQEKFKNFKIEQS